MERLTRVIKGHGNDVIVYTQGKYTDTTAGEMKCKDVRNVMKHLCDYENTGLTPPEIMELAERDTAKKIEINAGIPTCPVCGRRIVKCYDFCPDCGQRMEQYEEE